jgi:chromosome segregation ATPase
VDDNPSTVDALTRLPARLMALVELLTSLDTRVASTLDAIDEMRTSVTAFDPAREDVEALVADLRTRVARAEERINADLDDLKAAILDKLGEIDLTGLGPRFDRLEEAVFNIERATINMDRTLEGGVGLLPDFLTRKVRAEGKREAPALSPEADGR